jgi:hypothetical protein
MKNIEIFSGTSPDETPISTMGMDGKSNSAPDKN